MKNLSFKDGYESFTVNGDENRIVRFNPADPEIINRLLKLKTDFQDYKPEADLELNPDGTPKSEIEKEGAFVAEFTTAMRKAFNDIFNSDVYDTIFDGQSPLCIVGQKKKESYLFEAVLEAVMELMRPAINEYSKKNQSRMQKYLGDLQ